MDKEQFIERLVALRMKKGVSARDMSLSIGQSPSYINNIENGINLPSMTAFFYICDYLNISPSEFFDLGTLNPERIKGLIVDLKSFDDSQLTAVETLVRALKRNG